MSNDLSGRDLIGDWNDDPPPTDGFLKAQAAYEAVRKRMLSEPFQGQRGAMIDAYFLMIEAVSSRQDLAQFLLCAADVVLDGPTYNASTEEYWDGLAGVISGADELDSSGGAEQWKLWAQLLSKATTYE